MVNMNIERQAMPVQPAKERAHNFKEVALGYEEETALAEAGRCLNCRNKPCIGGCPVGIDIPAFIQKMKEKDFAGAYEVISASSCLPAVCGRVCPQESQCEKVCTRGIKGQAVAIGRLERFCADWHRAQNTPVEKPAANGHKVAIVGSGPSGLSCAGELAAKGYDVTIYEALHAAGGVLIYGIPAFRLPKDIVAKEVDDLKAKGVKIETDVIIGKSLSIQDLFDQGFEAVYIGTGAGLPMFMNIPGENYNGVMSANEFLTRVNLMKAYQLDSETPLNAGRRVAVVGGGNVAMDAARCALRLGAEKVYIVYRRSMAELPARREEVEHAEQEGIEFHLLINPVEVLGDENYHVRGLKCIKMELGEPDASGRRRPVPVAGSEFELDVDTVIMALGTRPNPLLTRSTPGLAVNDHGGLIVTDAEETSLKNVYAGGDAVTGSATVIKAMGAGKQAAAEIDCRLNAKQ
jgi:glutamate synthase (NADPH/NADH) small chain